MLNLICPINQLGYGVVGQNLITNLDCNLFPIGDKFTCEPKNFEEIQKKLNTNKRFDKDGPCIKVWHQHDMTGFTGGLKIGFPIFELDSFTENEKYHLNYCDRLFICSEWAKSICEKELDNPDVRVIPLGVDMDIFYPENNIIEPTIFFTCGKWEKRKAHDKIIEIFGNTFSEQDNVYLVMVCDNPFLTQEQTNNWTKLVKNSPLKNKIKLYSKFNTQVDLARVMNSVTCGIFPALAEGWNLELLEMMACNKPVITTNYSGHTQFCNEENSFLIEFQQLETAKDDSFFKGNSGKWGKWTSLQDNQLANYMKFIHNNNIKENYAGLKTAKSFSWKNTAETILKNVS